MQFCMRSGVNGCVREQFLIARVLYQYFFLSNHRVVNGKVDNTFFILVEYLDTLCVFCIKYVIILHETVPSEFKYKMENTLNDRSRS